jgi:phenylpropionate dioxygenase-like ring-hydroxylating dioxygenase large terminal subunit
LAVERARRSPVRALYRPEQYRLEQDRIFKGPTWSFLCLATELPAAGDWVATTIGETAVVAARDQDGVIKTFANRCAHRGNLLCLERRGHGRELKCIYQGWTYDLAGKLTGVAFERGVKRQGGMPPEFRKDDHDLPRLRVAELAGLVFGTFNAKTPALEDYRGGQIVGGIRRVLNRRAHILGRSTQVLPNNWKLYFENTKDTYHASILHTFLTTFRINRLSMPGGIHIDDSGRHHFSQAKLDYDAEDADYRREGLHSDTDLRLADPSVVESVDEYGDGVSVQILTVFPGMILQQIRNSIAARVVRPRGLEKTELDWIHLGFDDDDTAMTERRLRQGNLVGAAGYVSMEDGGVGVIVQRALRCNDDDSGIVLMGGYDAQSQPFRSSEAAIRGFWKKYRALVCN